VQISGLPLDN